ncbi:LysR family substrate-binding domain-containing protein [Streptomyces sp. NPDC002992]|uniref:LysR family substrate-binding domain-containing protein n=1 Tax=Streptomyces sp. NPDC002992 TaxID=3154273 RepID=UPI0033A39B48
MTEGFVAVLPTAHPLAARRTVRVAELADAPCVLLPPDVGPHFHDRIVALCRAAGFEPRVAQRAVEWQTVCALVEAGLGLPGAREHPSDPPQGRHLPRRRAGRRAYAGRRRRLAPRRRRSAGRPASGDRRRQSRPRRRRRLTVGFTHPRSAAAAERAARPPPGRGRPSGRLMRRRRRPARWPR